jgi:phosphatidylglycerophosphate synthase
MRLSGEQVWTLPNALTLVRLPLAGLVWAAPDSRTWLLAIVASAALSDMLDGRVARAIRSRRLARGDDPQRIGEAYAIGAWLDPMCDKLFVLSAAAAVAYAYAPPLGEILLIATREVILSPLVIMYALWPRLRRRVRFDFRAGLLGKATTLFQVAAITSIVLWPEATLVLAIASAVIGLAASADYLSRARAMARYTAQQSVSYERWLEIQAELRAIQRVIRRR